MSNEHLYDVEVTWTGNRGSGTSAYAAYGREHEVASGAAPTIPGSADPAFRGDPSRWNPEQLLVAALSQCHMLWYLHLAAAAGVVVTAYTDQAHGVLAMEPSGAGQFTEVVLRPAVTIADGDPDVAQRLHHDAAAMCFIARSVAFRVRHEPTIDVQPR